MNHTAAGPTDPPDRVDSRLINRRRFMERGIFALFGGLAAILGLPIVRYVLSPIFGIKEDLALSTQWAPVAPLSEMEKVEDIPKTFHVPYRIFEGWRYRDVSRPVFAVKEGGELVLFSAYCTHLGCPTFWDLPRGTIVCPCHGGLYNNLGQVVGGPPPRDLPRLVYKVENDVVYLKSPAEG
ncbi:MAG TPA: ubiquinol-cytochrome c reductase iron-sulfur subunit [Candidatus Manganitrophaceae bacterium]|nr:ubiquinol-cytochrome c reductase iron-sulfur subunit [Candidatus Manganitrophaceae bacterium]